jgi:uncharacterized protein (TIGR03435 family)
VGQFSIRDALTGRKRVIVVGLAAVVGTVAVCILLVAAAVSMQPERSAEWVQFSIGPASGQGYSLSPAGMQASGITVKAALATAYDIPAVRIIAPPWVADTRYTIIATVDVDEPDRLRPLLQQELNARLGLKTHLEVRSFDVFVMTVDGAPRLTPAGGKSLRVWNRDWDAQLENASVGSLTASLQSVLGKPVIDETGITGLYNMEFRWTPDRVASVSATLLDRFGLRLTPARRDMEALVVENIERDAVLTLLGHAGRVMRRVPPHLRQRIAQALTIHY